MHPTCQNIHFVYLALAIVLDVAANILLKYSNGFEKKTPAIFAILCVFASFTALSFAIEGIHLSVAYGVWGGVGLISTTLLSIFLFGERLKATGWFGMALIMFGVTLVRMA